MDVVLLLGKCTNVVSSDDMLSWHIKLKTKSTKHAHTINQCRRGTRLKHHDTMHLWLAFTNKRNKDPPKIVGRKKNMTIGRF